MGGLLNMTMDIWDKLFDGFGASAAPSGAIKP